ncbi:MAG: MbnP family copper-binding protein [Rhodocyclaceae bacterium]
MKDTIKMIKTTDGTMATTWAPAAVACMRPSPSAVGFRGRRLLLPALLALGFSACGGGGSSSTETPPDSSPRQVSIQFAAKAGQTAVDCNTPIAALGSGALQTELSDLRLYLSEIALIATDGTAVEVALADNEWQHPAAGVVLIDLEDGTGSCVDRGTPGTNAQIAGTVPAGSYKGLRFTVGVPSNYNHTDTVAEAAPLDIQAMGWSWQAGRKYIKIEVAPSGGVVRPADPTANPPVTEGFSARWNLHLGATGCTGNPVSGETVSCTSSNRMELRFDDFNADTQRFVIDLQSLLLTTDLSLDYGGPYGCMSGKTDPECPVVFEALSLDLDSGLTANQGLNQKMFRIEAR